MIQKLLSNTQMIWMIFKKILKNRIQIKNEKQLYLSIWLLIYLVIKNLICNLIVTELFLRGRKLNIYLVFITQSYFSVPKNIRLNSTHYFVTKIRNKKELQQISFNHASDIDFMNLYQKFTEKPYFLVIDTTIA